MKQLSKIRANFSIQVEEGTMNLIPTAEVVLLIHEPEYVLRDGEAMKLDILKDTRIHFTMEGLNNFIIHLEAVREKLIKVEGMLEVEEVKDETAKKEWPKPNTASDIAMRG